MSKKNITNQNNSLSIKLKVRNFIVLLAILSSVMFVVVILLFYPGYTSSDSDWQLRQALGLTQLSDWAPISMALLWGFIIKITGQPSGLLILQLAWLWTGLFLLSVYIYKYTYSRILSLAVLIIGILPFTINIQGVLWKDTQMTFAIILALSVSLVSKYCLQNKNQKIILYFVAIILLMYVASVRSNGFVAALPIIYLVFHYTSRNKNAIFKVVMSVLVIILTSSLMWGIGKLANVQPGNIDRSMKEIDIVNIVPPSKIEGAAIPQNLKKELLDLSKCSRYSDKIELKFWVCGVQYGPDDPSNTELSSLSDYWLTSIKNKPLTYLTFKAQAFKIFLFDTTYIFQIGNTGSVDLMKSKYSDQSAAMLLKYTNYGFKYLTWFYKAWFWLLCLIFIIIFSFKYKLKRNIEIKMIALSGLMYILSFSISNVTPDFRYFYWPIFATLFSLILIISEKSIAIRLSNRKTYN